MKPSNNTSSQNERTAASIRELTIRFRKRDSQFQPALYDFLTSQGVDPMRSVLLTASFAEQGTNPIVGHILTQNGQFFDFDIDCDTSGTIVADLHDWSENSSLQNLSANSPGYKKGDGRIAIEVQQKLNGNDDISTDGKNAG